MERALAALHEQLMLNTDLLANALEGIDAEQAERRPEGGNSLVFIAAHMADARFFLAKQLGSSVESPITALAGVNDIDSLQGALPPLAETLRHWRDGGKELAARFATLDSATLAKESPIPFPLREVNLLGTIAFLLHHEAFHLGQVALLRRRFGHAAMSYARAEA